MKKKLSRILSVFVVLTLMMAMLTACSGGSVSNKDSLGGLNSAFDSAQNVGGIRDDYEYGTGSSVSDKVESDIDVDNESVDSARKIIERIDMTIETKGFDELLGMIEQRIKEVNGYIEMSDVYGNSYYDTDDRSARIVARIPCNKSDTFIDFVAGNGVVTYKSVETDDVTLRYVDVESRLEALKIEKASLEKLLAEADNIVDIITVQDRLTDVIYEIESANSQLRTFDNLIDYTTITLDIEEVETPTIVHEQTVWERIATKFTKNINRIKDDIVDLFVAIVGGSPYFLIYAIFIVVIVCIIKKIAKKQSKVKLATMEATVSSTTDATAVANDAELENIDSVESMND